MMEPTPHIARQEADAMLADIAAVAQRVKQSEIYRAAGLLLMFWGGIVIAGNLTGFAVAPWAGYSWTFLDAFGATGTLMILRRVPRGRALRRPMLAAFALFFGFGLVWSRLFGQFGPRELDAFWPSLFLFGYALAGLWFGRGFTVLGVGLAALVIAGYLWTGAAFDLYLAAVNGGGLLLCGLWMRRA